MFYVDHGLVLLFRTSLIFISLVPDRTSQYFFFLAVRFSEPIFLGFPPPPMTYCSPGWPWIAWSGISRKFPVSGKCPLLLYVV